MNAVSSRPTPNLSIGGQRPGKVGVDKDERSRDLFHSPELPYALRRPGRRLDFIFCKLKNIGNSYIL
jgi:hypothetical protein